MEKKKLCRSLVGAVEHSVDLLLRLRLLPPLRPLLLYVKLPTFRFSFLMILKRVITIVLSAPNNSWAKIARKCLRSM
jgi:hypothetical protein